MKAIFRVLLISVAVMVIALVAFNYNYGTLSWPATGREPGALGTAGTMDRERAGAGGAEVRHRAAIALDGVEQAFDETSLTAKIKGKMALDDNVRARAIDVTTHGSIVTVSGMVGSVAEHDRALTLARDTSGVTQVLDRMVIRPDRN